MHVSFRSMLVEGMDRNSISIHPYIDVLLCYPSLLLNVTTQPCFLQQRAMLANIISPAPLVGNY
jgi:hypothetical protein